MTNQLEGLFSHADVSQPESEQAQGRRRQQALPEGRSQKDRAFGAEEVSATMTQPLVSHPNSQRSLVTFQLAQRTYALPVESIAQIIGMVTITPLPQVDHSVEGVINVRGAAVPVVSLRRHFGLPEVPLQLNTPIILTQVDGRAVGLIVDEVIDVLGLLADQIAQPADILPEGLVRPPMLKGVAYTSDGAVLLLDVRHLFSPGQMQALTKAIEAVSEVVVGEAPEELPVEAEPEVAIEEKPEEPPVETELPPAPSRRKRRTRAKETAEASPTEEKPQPTRSRRRKRRPTKAAAESPEATSSEVEAQESSGDEPQDESKSEVEEAA